MHDVYIDSAYLYNVTAVEVEAGREINVYDGLQSGKFGIPQSSKLKKWHIECQLTQQSEGRDSRWVQASTLLRSFDQAMKSREPQRLVIHSANYKESVLVQLVSYRKAETSTGIFDVTLEYQEHVPVGVRTQDVPHVPRPGKVPTPPKTVVFNGRDVTPYSVQKKVKDTMWYQGGREVGPNPEGVIINFRDVDTQGSSKNPSTIKPGDKATTMIERLGMEEKPPVVRTLWDTLFSSVSAIGTRNAFKKPR